MAIYETKKITEFKSLFDQRIKREITIDEYLSIVKNDELDIRYKLEYIRDLKQRGQDYKKFKEKLPVFCFNSTFNPNKTPKDNGYFKALSGIIFIDIDNINENIENLKEAYIQRPYVKAVYTSSTGAGLHVLCYLDITPELLKLCAQYGIKKAFKTIIAEINQIYFDNKIDGKCCNYNRCTFLSYDGNIKMKDDSDITPIKINPRDIESRLSISAPPLPTLYTTSVQNDIQLDSNFLKDYYELDYPEFHNKYRDIYPLILETPLDYSSGDGYIRLPENYTCLVRYCIVEYKDSKRYERSIKIKEGKRALTLYKAGVLKKYMKPDITLETMLFNLYYELYHYIHNASNPITKNELVRIAINAYNADLSFLTNIKRSKHKYRFNAECYPEINQICDGQERRKIKNQLLKQTIDTHKNEELLKVYDKNLSVKENKARLTELGYKISIRSLYNFCKRNNIHFKSIKDRSIPENS